MITNRDDDYLICKHYYNNLDKVSNDYKDFITFEHKGNHYFAWLNDGKVILRSEAYPDYERTIRGIKAIIKNRDIEDRYSIDSQHGVHFLCLWGGGKNNKHTGNMGEHNEIGRSCPAKSKEALYDLIKFKGDSFASAVTGGKVVSSVSGKKAAAAAVVGATSAASLASAKSSKVGAKAKASATVTKEKVEEIKTDDSASGFKWWWLLLPLLALAGFFLLKGCDGDSSAVKDSSMEKIGVTTASDKRAEDAKVNLDTEGESDVIATGGVDDTAKSTADAEAKIKADAEAKQRADAQAKIKTKEAAAKVAAAAKAKRDAERKAKTGGSVSQENIKIGNKNSGF